MSVVSVDAKYSVFGLVGALPVVAGSVCGEGTARGSYRINRPWE